MAGYDNNIFSKNLNSYMEKTDTKSIDLARALNVSKSTVSSWVNAQKIPRMDKIEALADYFGILKSDLLEDHNALNNETITMGLKENLKQLRTEKDMTLEQVADYIGITRQTMQKYESGVVKNIPSDKIEKIATLFSVEPAYLMGWTDEATEDMAFSPRTMNHANQYEQLDDEGKDAVDFATERENRRMGTIRSADRFISLMVSRQGVSAGTGTYLYPDDFRTIQVKESLLPYGVKFAVPICGDSMEPKFHDGQLALVGEEYAGEGEIGIFAVNGDGYIKELRGNRLHSLNPKYDDIPYDTDTIRPIGKIIGVLNIEDIKE